MRLVARSPSMLYLYDAMSTRWRAGIGPSLNIWSVRNRPPLRLVAVDHFGRVGLKRLEDGQLAIPAAEHVEQLLRFLGGKVGATTDNASASGEDRGDVTRLAYSAEAGRDRL
jgi:hypothetical protein